MNLKERGITVGDLLIILLIILTTSILVKTFEKDKKSKLNLIQQEKLSYDNYNYQNSIRAALNPLVKTFFISNYC